MMKRAFVSIANSYVGCCVAGVLHRHGYEVVGSVREEDNEDIEGTVAKTVDVNDEQGTVNLALGSDVIVICLIEDVRGADAVLTALHFSRNEADGPSHLLVLSTTMTWAKTKVSIPTTTIPAAAEVSPFTLSPLSRPVSMMAMGRRPPSNAGAGLPRVSSAAVNSTSPSREASRQRTTGSPKITNAVPRLAAGNPSFRRRQPEPPSEPVLGEGDYLLREPPTGYLEHKRLEDAALRLRSPRLSACVVGSGVPYGVGEGPLLRLFRAAWMQRDGAPLQLPTSAAGSNRLALIHVVDLSAAIGELLLPRAHPDAPPAPFPKPYILVVDGDASQPTAKEATEAIGKAFGGSGETEPMTAQELEEIVVDDPSALHLLFDLRFSTDGGVLADMVTTERLDPVTWPRGFVASAKQLAKEFVTCRSLKPIKAVLLGPPRAGQDYVCDKISQRYGLMHVDAKVAADSIFTALGKPLPERAPPEEKVVPSAKGKKGKDVKKGPNKGEQAADIQAALAELSPTERLMHDMQAAFEAAEVPMAEYTAFDASGLSRILPPRLVARAARRLLEETRERWSRSGFILCDIPSRDHCISEIFEEQGESTPLAEAVTGGGGGGNSNSNSNGASENDSESAGPLIHHPSARVSSTFDGGAMSLRPTQAVYLAATARFILREEAARQRSLEPTPVVGGVGGEDKLREEIERYFEAESQKHQRADARKAKVDRPKTNGSLGEDSTKMEEEGINDGATSSKLWLPATVVTLRDDFATKAQAVDAEADLSSVVNAVDLQLTGGETPAFVWMLAGEDIGEGSYVPVGGLETADAGGCAGAPTERDHPLGVGNVGEAEVTRA